MFLLLFFSSPKHGALASKRSVKQPCSVFMRPFHAVLLLAARAAIKTAVATQGWCPACWWGRPLQDPPLSIWSNIIHSFFTRASLKHAVLSSVSWAVNQAFQCPQWRIGTDKMDASVLYWINTCTMIKYMYIFFNYIKCSQLNVWLLLAWAVIVWFVFGGYDERQSE